MDYYSKLGVNRNASADEIKKAYRSMAMKYHPDRGGDEKKFKEIEEAYRTLSDPQKKQMVDMGMDPNNQNESPFHRQGPFEFHFGSQNLNDIFGNFGFGFHSQRPMRNKSLNINIEINLEEVLTGKEINAEVGIPGQKTKIINISIPPGIESGQQIKYQGMGDDSIRDLRPGDLIVNIFVRPHSTFRREGDNIICEKNISVWDAMLGNNIQIPTLDKKTIDIKIPAGTQPDTILSCKGEGLVNMRSRRRGSLLVKIKIQIPTNLDQSLIEQIEKIKNGI
jgi:curved DNA-binding protein